MMNKKQYKYTLFALPPLLGILIIREIPIFYASADYYYYKRIFYDFWELGSTWSEMYFGPAPGLFTNMLPLAIINLFVEDLPRQFLFHVCLYGMLTMAIIAYLIRSVTRDYLAVVTGVAMAILLIVTIGGDNSFWNRPSHHYGSVINLLLAMALMVTGANSRFAVVCLYLVVILTVISDFLYIPMYMAMTSGVMLVYWLSGSAPFQMAFLRGVFYILPVVAGVVLHYLVIPNVVPNPVWASGMSLREVLTSPALHLEAFQFLFVEGVRLPVYWVSIVLGLVTLFSLWQDKSRSAQYFLYYFIAMQCVIWSNIYMSGLGDTAVVRYRLFAVNGSCVVIAISAAILAFQTGKRAIMPWVMLGTIFALAAGCLLWPDEDRVDYQVKQEVRYIRLVNEVACVEKVVRENNLSAGISAYKEANPFTILSDGKVYLYPVEGDNVRPLNWLVSGVGLKRKFDYAVVTRGITESYYNYPRVYNQLGRFVVEKAYGEPVKTVNCDKFAVLVYSQIDFGKGTGG